VFTHRSFLSAISDAFDRHYQVRAAAAPPVWGPYSSVGEPMANALVVGLLDGQYDSVSVAAAGTSHLFPLASAEVAVRWASTSCNIVPAAADASWRRFTYRRDFAIDMPEGTQEVAGTHPGPGGAPGARVEGLRGADGLGRYNATFLEFLDEDFRPGEWRQQRFFDGFVTGMLSSLKRDGSTVEMAAMPGLGDLAREGRIEHVNGATQFFRVVGRRIYVLSLVCRTGPEALARKDRFLNSFRLL
jgi:hypothetical protein